MKRIIPSRLIRFLVALPLLLSSALALANPTQLGFAIDGSGSVSSTDFAIQRDGLAQALNAIPTDSTVEVTIVQFASGAQIQVAPTLIDSPATLASVIAQTQAMVQLGGGTNAGAALNLLTNAMTGSANFGGDSLINLSTDGIIDVGSTLSAAIAAKAAGIDSVTAEAIGPFANVNSLLSVVYGPTTNPNDGSAILLPLNSATVPNPLTSASAWVLPVSTFAAYGPAVQAKIQAVVNPVPEPGTLSMLGLGLLCLGFASRRRAAAL